MDKSVNNCAQVVDKWWMSADNPHMRYARRTSDASNDKAAQGRLCMNRITRPTGVGNACQDKRSGRLAQHLDGYFNGHVGVQRHNDVVLTSSL